MVRSDYNLKWIVTLVISVPYQKNVQSFTCEVNHLFETENNSLVLDKVLFILSIPILPFPTEIKNFVVLKLVHKPLSMNKNTYSVQMFRNKMHENNRNDRNWNENPKLYIERQYGQYLWKWKKMCVVKIYYSKIVTIL